MSAYTHAVTYMYLDNSETVTVRYAYEPTTIREGFDLSRGVVVYVHALDTATTER